MRVVEREEGRCGGGEWMLSRAAAEVCACVEGGKATGDCSGWGRSECRGLWVIAPFCTALHSQSLYTCTHADTHNPWWLIRGWSERKKIERNKTAFPPEADWDVMLNGGEGEMKSTSWRCRSCGCEMEFSAPNFLRTIRSVFLAPYQVNIMLTTKSQHTLKLISCACGFDLSLMFLQHNKIVVHDSSHNESASR